MKRIKSCFIFYAVIILIVFGLGCIVGVCITPNYTKNGCYEVESPVFNYFTTTDGCYEDAAAVLDDYRELTASGRVSSDYRICESSDYADGTCLEISGVGIYTVRRNESIVPGNIVIFFSSVESAAEFNKKTVKVRVCDDEI